MMRDERTAAAPPGMGCNTGVSDFRIAVRVEELAHGVDDLGACEEHLFHARIDDKVDITLAVALFRIGERIEHLTVFLPTTGRGRIDFCSVR